MVARMNIMLVVVCSGMLLTGCLAKKHKHEFEPPKWCRDLDCPRFETVDEGKGYTVRKYEKSAWVETVVEGSTFTAAQATAMTRLYQYMHGNNDDKVTMAKTTPTATLMRIEKGGTSTEQNYTIGAYLPWKYQDGDKRIPKPDVDGVYLTCYDSWTTYVKNVSGFATESTFLNTRQALQQTLLEEEEEFEPSWFVAAVYDPPTTLLNRHNEVWMAPRGGKRDGQPLEQAAPQVASVA